MKKTIYILPGWSYDTTRWEALINLLEEDNFKVNKLKIPGLEEKIEKAWDIDDYINWLDKKIEQEEVILLGHSNGGRIALSYVLKNPDKVSNLILIGSAGLIDSSTLLKLKKTVFKSLAKFGKNLNFPDFTKKILYKAAREKDYLKADQNLKKTMQNLIKIDLEKKLSDIKIPTTIIWGENDKVTPVKFADVLNSKIANSKKIIINGARHSPQYTHPEKVLDAIVKNLS